MTTHKEALTLTLAALKQIDAAMPFPVAKLAIMEAEKALAQPEQNRPQNCGTGFCSCIECVMESEQNPVAWLVEFENGEQELHFEEQAVGETNTPLYTTPPQRTWVGLTEDEIDGCVWGQSERDHAKAVEAKLKEKNT